MGPGPGEGLQGPGGLGPGEGRRAGVREGGLDLQGTGRTFVRSFVRSFERTDGNSPLRTSLPSGPLPINYGDP